MTAGMISPFISVRHKFHGSRFGIELRNYFNFYSVDTKTTWDKPYNTLNADESSGDYFNTTQKLFLKFYL